jgi:hypothetical protein
MNISTRSVSIVLALVFAVVLWFGAVPQTLSPRSYAITVGLAAVLAAISMVMYRNGQGTGSVGQLLHETDTAAQPAVSGAPPLGAKARDRS